MSPKFVYLFIVLCYVSLLGCQPSPQYQQHYSIPKQSWDYSYQPLFTFSIADTSAAYQLFFLIRHTDAYPFNNIWLMMETRSPGDTSFHKMRVEIPLAETSGHWLGRGMGEIWEQRLPFNANDKPAFFRKKGEYTIRLVQDMRRNPLPEVLQVGLRLEKLGTPIRVQSP